MYDKEENCWLHLTLLGLVPFCSVDTSYRGINYKNPKLQNSQVMKISKLQNTQLQFPKFKKFQVTKFPSQKSRVTKFSSFEIPKLQNSQVINYLLQNSTEYESLFLIFFAAQNVVV